MPTATRGGLKEVWVTQFTMAAATALSGASAAST